MKKYTKLMAYGTCSIAFVGSVVGWWYPQVAVGMSAAAALLALTVAMNIKD